MKTKLARFLVSLTLISMSLPVIANNFAADLIIVNATVRTMDPARPSAEAIAILGNRIVAIGTSGEISKLAGPNTRIIDAKKRLVLPGFNDAHVHFLS